MALPQMTEEQRAEALKKAAETRKKRSEFRAKIKAGKVTAKKALSQRDDPIVGKIKVAQFIQSFPGWGKAKAEKLMDEIGIAEDRAVKYAADSRGTHAMYDAVECATVAVRKCSGSARIGRGWKNSVEKDVASRGR